MRTFLTNDKMHPALVARIGRSLRARSASARYAPGVVALLRAGALIAIGVFVLWLIAYQHERTDALETGRATLLRELDRARAELPPDAANVEAALSRWLVEMGGVYAGDLFEDEVRAQGLRKLATRPSIYVRGAIASLGDHSGIASAAAESSTDEFVACLFEPPTAADEPSLVERIRAGSTAPANVERLSAVMAGASVLKPAFAERVRLAEDEPKLAQLDELFRLAPVEAAQRALRAELFVFVLDEPKTDNSPSEFDGTTRHFARVHVVDLAGSKLLLRARRLVDPAWISEARRHRQARVLTGCRLAFDVHEGARTASSTGVSPRAADTAATP